MGQGSAARRVRWVRIAAYGGAIAFGLGIAAVVAAAGLYHHYVIAHPGPHLAREHILAVIAEESPVTYRDGTTRLGVFFQDEHRAFVGWRDLPPPYVAAIVAAEDGAFWSHRGLHPKHIVRAMYDNVSAGRMVAGGSTLTQQTAKNIFYRPDRSMRSKVQELVNALRLEAHFDKSEILTFYVNQFHVSGNGRGLGIAARYFFDCEVSDLTVLQSAFLAGLVKGPGLYDPFLGGPERQQAARRRAHQRTRYVLARIVDEPAENLVGPWEVPGLEGAAAQAARLRQVATWKAEARRLLDEGFDLPFKRGRFRYDSNAVLDEVRRRLARAPFDEVLKAAGVEDPDRAGLVVVTTLDLDVQREATYALWHHLTEVGAWLEKPTAKSFVREDSPGPRYDLFHTPKRHEFRLARVADKPTTGGRRTLSLDLGGHACEVDRDGLIRVALAVERATAGNRNVKVSGAKVDAFVEALPNDAVVWVSVRDVGSDGRAICDLERRPDLQGSVVIVRDGEILGMVGGNDNQNFNRATARRQFGSTWKTLVFHAALQLGWRPEEALDNRRNVFPFSTTFYYPRPDHAPEPVVSMSWAGAHSENLASVWLLYHLMDRLDGAQVSELARSLGLARAADESEADYRVRIQKLGVLPTRPRLREGLFLKARQEVLAQLASSRHPEDALGLTSMLYGWGHGAELTRVARESAASRARKTRALTNTFVHIEALAEECRSQHASLVRSVEQGKEPDPAQVPKLWVRSAADGLDVACGTVPEGFVRPDAEALAPWLSALDANVDGEAPEEEVAESRRGLGQRLSDLLGLGKKENQAVAEKESPSSPIAPFEDVLLDERVHVSTVEAIASSVARRQALLEVAGDSVDLYDPEYLYWHQDFRVLLAIRYVSELAHQYGVRSQIQPVLSLPLGASELTLEDATMLYEGLVTGKGWDFPGEVPSSGLLGMRPVPGGIDPALLIAEIRDVDGKVLYRAKPTSRDVGAVDTGALTADILRNVVVHGTGRRALQAIPANGGFVPLMGKTGTTNEYRNAAFLGVVPSYEGGGWRAERGFVVGVYVGYDDNKPMVNRQLRLAGASGALPVWIDTARGLLEAGQLGDLPPAPAEGWRISPPAGLRYVEVDATAGLLVGRPGGAPSRLDWAALDDDEVVLEDEGVESPPAEYAVLTFSTGARERAPAALDLMELPERIAPSTEEAIERARRRRALLEQLQEPRGLWRDDEL